MSIKLVEETLTGIQFAAKELLDRPSTKLRCNHGICVEIADILGWTYMGGPDDEKHFTTRGFGVCSVTGYVTHLKNIKAEFAYGELIDKRGEWTERRQELCELLISELGSEDFLNGFRLSQFYEPSYFTEEENMPQSRIDDGDQNMNQIDLLKAAGKTIKTIFEVSYNKYVVVFEGEVYSKVEVVGIADCWLGTSADFDLVCYHDRYPLVELGLVTQEEADEYSERQAKQAEELKSSRFADYIRLKKEFGE